MPDCKLCKKKDFIKWALCDNGGNVYDPKEEYYKERENYS